MKKEDLKEGMILKCKWGYDVIVVRDSDGELAGKLIADNAHACWEVLYSLNDPYYYEDAENFD